jgi:hypothetical protein
MNMPQFQVSMRRYLNEKWELKYQVTIYYGGRIFAFDPHVYDTHTEAAKRASELQVEHPELFQLTEA